MLECLAPENTLKLLLCKLLVSMQQGYEITIAVNSWAYHIVVAGTSCCKYRHFPSGSYNLSLTSYRDFLLHLQGLPTAYAGVSYCICRNFLLHLQWLFTAVSGTYYWTCRDFLLHPQGLCTSPAVTSYCTCRNFLLHLQELPSAPTGILLHLQ